MPLDPNIALSVQVPQTINPMTVFQQAQNMRLQREQIASQEEERRASAQLRQEQAAKLQADQAAQQHFHTAVSQGKTREAATQYAINQGWTDAGALIDKFYDDHDAALERIRTANDAHEKSQREMRNAAADYWGHKADFILDASDGGKDPTKMQAALNLSALVHNEAFEKTDPNSPNQTMQLWQSLSSMPPDQLAQHLQAIRANAPYYQAEQTKATEQANAPFTLGKDQIRFGPGGQQIATGPKGAPTQGELDAQYETTLTKQYIDQGMPPDVMLKYTTAVSKLDTAWGNPPWRSRPRSPSATPAGDRTGYGCPVRPAST